MALPLQPLGKYCYLLFLQWPSSSLVAITIKRELKGSGSGDIDSSDSISSESDESDEREVNSGSINECTPLLQ